MLVSIKFETLYYIIRSGLIELLFMVNGLLIFCWKEG